MPTTKLKYDLELLSGDRWSRLDVMGAACRLAIGGEEYWYVFGGFSENGQPFYTGARHSDACPGYVRIGHYDPDGNWHPAD